MTQCHIPIAFTFRFDSLTLLNLFDIYARLEAVEIIDISLIKRYLYAEPFLVRVLLFQLTQFIPARICRKTLFWQCKSFSSSNIERASAQWLHQQTHKSRMYFFVFIFRFFFAWRTAHAHTLTNLLCAHVWL